MLPATAKTAFSYNYTNSNNPTADRILPLEVTVNGAKSGTWLLVEHSGALYAPIDAFENWRVQLNPKAQSIQFKDQNYWPLASVSGYKSNVDYANQSLELQFSPEAFASTHLTQAITKKLTVSPALTSIFLNYDLNYALTELRGAPTVQDMGMISEMGISSNLGILTNSTLGRNLSNNSAQGIPISFLRLETTFTKDLPDINKTFSLGDTSSHPGLLGSSVYYGGIKFGTNFALTPGFISRPSPNLIGSSLTPSTVDLYVNDVLRQTSNIPAGPFSINNSPALTGGGEARMVVHDLLGRETVITQSFFTSNKLLAKGLDDWSIEAGDIRRDLGISNANYGPTFARGIWRHGYNEKFTFEGLAEVAQAQRTLELGLVSAMPGQWLGSTAFVASQNESLGSGNQWLLGLERQGLRNSIFLQAQGASINFRQLGQANDIKPLKLELAANWTYASDRLGSFGIEFAAIRQFDAKYIDTMTANYSINLLGRGSLSLNASSSQGGFTGSSIGLSFILPLDNNRVASLSTISNQGQNDFYLSMSKNPTQDNNLGWRVLAGQQQNQRHDEGGLNYLGQYGNLNGDVSSSPNQTALRLGANGGLMMVDGHLFASKRLDGSAALTEVAGYDNVGIGLGNNVLTHTDANGIALIPQLVPYQNNSVQLDPNDLPVSAEIDSIEQIAVPAWRSVVKVKFPVRSGRGALLKIKLDDGDVAPAGATVQIEGDNQKFYVARRGETFVTGLQPINHMLLTWNNQQCNFDVMPPTDKSDEIMRIGPLLCKGVLR